MNRNYNKASGINFHDENDCLNQIILYYFIFHHKNKQTHDKDAKCNSTVLSSSIEQINIELNQTQTNMDLLKTAKISTRKAIDCHPNGGGTKSRLFDHYEGLCKRMVILKNVYQDLIIKRNALEQEKLRCHRRSKFRVISRSLQINCLLSNVIIMRPIKRISKLQKVF